MGEPIFWLVYAFAMFSFGACCLCSAFISYKRSKETKEGEK